jgi:hypothetical protein
MKRIKLGTLVILGIIVLIVLGIILLIIFNTSRFGTLGIKDQNEYLVQLNFSYTNPRNFNGTWNGIILYLEELSEETTTPEYIDKQISASDELFTSKNLFYTNYYSTFYQNYTSWINPEVRKQIVKDSNFSTNLNKLLDGTGISGTTDNYENLNILNNFIKHFKIPNELYMESSTGQINSTQGNVELSTLDSFKLKLEKKKYKFGLAIINNKLVLNPSDYDIFPFTISDFRFTTFDISNVLSNPAGAPEDLSVYVTFL